MIDGRRSRRFRQRLSSRLLASRSMIPMSIAQDESMNFSFFDFLMSGTSHSLPQPSLVLPQFDLFCALWAFDSLWMRLLIALREGHIY